MSLWLVGSTLAVLVGAGMLVFATHPAGLIDRIVATGVFASANVILITGVAGIAGILRPDVLSIGAVIVLVISTSAARRSGALRRPMLPRPAVTARRVMRLCGEQPWVASLAIAACSALAWQTVVGLVLPPFAFDGIGYHLTITADWLQAGNIAASDLSLCCSRYPLAPELMFAWTWSLGVTDALVDLVQIPFVLLGASAVAGLARSAGLERPRAVAAASIFALTPIVLAQAPTNYVDIIVAAWSLAAMHALVRYATDPRWHHLATAGVATGLVFGVKGIGVLWGIGLSAAGWALVLRRATDLRTALYRTATLASGVVVLGSFWYIRNWIQTGNPLMPFEVVVAGRTVFDGPFDLSSAPTPAPGGSTGGVIGEVAYSWLSDAAIWRIRGYDHQQRAGGLGPTWSLLGLACSVAFAWTVVRRRGPMLIPLVLTAVVLAMQPYRWWSRFTIQLAAIGAISIVWAIGALGRKGGRLLAVAVLVTTLIGAGAVVRRVDPAARAEPLPAGDLLSLIRAPSDERSLASLFFPEYEFLRAIPVDATVYVDLSAEPLRFVSPIFGHRRERRIEPASSVAPPVGAWVVTAPGRPIDGVLERSEGFVRRYDEDITVWGPSERD